MKTELCKLKMIQQIFRFTVTADIAFVRSNRKLPVVCYFANSNNYYEKLVEAKTEIKRW